MRVVAIVGATATGKTAVAETVADLLGGELVCADSRQVFRALEIGTGKPTPVERRARPHHLFEALDLAQRPSAGWWARAATAACHDIAARGRLPILVGGTGLYVRSLQHGIAAEPTRDATVRERLMTEARALGAPALHARLATIDPATAARLAPADTQRVTRALEVWEASGKPLSWWQRERPGPPFPAEWRVVEITCERDALAARIASRTTAMFDDGLVEETQAIVDAGHGAALAALHAVGYDEALSLVAGGIDRAVAESSTNERTRRLAKRQRTWFRHQIEATVVDGTRLDVVAMTDRVLEVFKS